VNPVKNNTANKNKFFIIKSFNWFIE